MLRRTAALGVGTVSVAVARGCGGETVVVAARLAPLAAADPATAHWSNPTDTSKLDLPQAVEPLLAAACIGDERDEGFVRLRGAGEAAAFVSACRSLRFWDRVRSGHLAKRQPQPRIGNDRCASGDITSTHRSALPPVGGEIAVVLASRGTGAYRR